MVGSLVAHYCLCLERAVRDGDATLRRICVELRGKWRALLSHRRRRDVLWTNNAAESAIGISEIRRKTVKGMRERRRDAKQVWADASGHGAAPFAGGVSSSETRPKMTNRFWDDHRASAAPAGGQLDLSQISRRLRNLRKSMFCKRLGGIARGLSFLTPLSYL